MNRSAARLVLYVALAVIVGVMAPKTWAGQPIADPRSGNAASFAPDTQADPKYGIPHPVLTDVRVRRAIAYCTDRLALVGSVYPFLDSSQRQLMMMDTFLPKSHPAYSPPPSEYTYPYNPTLGQQLLEEAGWTLAPGARYRTKGDKELALTLTTTTAQFRQTWIAALADQLSQCGIRLIPSHVSARWFFDFGLSHREFELGVFAWRFLAGFWVRSLYGCDRIPIPANGWQGSNFMGWCNERAHNAILAAGRTPLRAERLQQYAVVQEEFAKDMISLPAFHRAEIAASHKDLQGYAPNPSQFDTWNAHQWYLPGVETIVIGTTQPVESLFPLTSFMDEEHRLAGLIYGFGVTSNNHDYQAMLYKSLPTLENGGAVTQTVTVSAGDWVVDVFGELVNLAPGTRVVNSAGQEVVYTQGAIQMTQLVVTGSFLDNLRWSDGAPLVQADLRLWDRVNCDPALGRTNRLECNYTVRREYLDDTTVRYTLVPGYWQEDYVTLVPGAYPSHRRLSDGRRLGEVPPAEWPELPEIKRWPIGLGPYRILDWTQDRMVFGANPYFALGAPRTPVIEVRFFPWDTSALLRQFFEGSVHIVSSSSLGAGGEAAQVVEADREGRVKAYVMPSTFWEHIDFNLATFPKRVLPLVMKQ